MVLGLCMCNFLVEDSREDSKHQHQGALYLTPQRIIFFSFTAAGSVLHNIKKLLEQKDKPNSALSPATLTVLSCLILLYFIASFGKNGIKRKPGGMGKNLSLVNYFLS